MSSRIKRTAVILALVLAVSAVAAGQDLTGITFDLPSARSDALGGPHAALTDDIISLANNPAGFIAAEPELSISELSMNLQGPIFDIAGVVAGGFGGNIGQLLATPNVQNLLQSIYTGMNLLGPVSFAYVGNGLGFGIYNGTNVTLETTAPLTLAFAASEQLILSGGYAVRIPLPSSWNSTLDVGLLLKGSLKGVSLLSASLFELPALFSSIGPSTLTNEPFDLISAIGLDAGLRYSFNQLITVGLVGRNIYTPTLTSSYTTLQSFLSNSQTPTTSAGNVPFDLSVGMLYTPDLGFLDRYISNLKVMADYNDSLGFLTHPTTAKNPVLLVGLGSELTLLRVLDIRAGFYQGLFSAGLGLDLQYFRFDASMFGSELSTQPGLRSVYNLVVELNFRI